MSKVQQAVRSEATPAVLPAAPSRVAGPQEQPLRFLLIRLRPGELPWLARAMAATMGPVEIVQVVGMGNALWRLGHERFDSVLLDPELDRPAGDPPLPRADRRHRRGAGARSGRSAPGRCSAGEGDRRAAAPPERVRRSGSLSGRPCGYPGSAAPNGLRPRLNRRPRSAEAPVRGSAFGRLPEQRFVLQHEGLPLTANALLRLRQLEPQLDRAVVDAFDDAGRPARLDAAEIGLGGSDGRCRRRSDRSSGTAPAGADRSGRSAGPRRRRRRHDRGRLARPPRSRSARRATTVPPGATDRAPAPGRACDGRSTVPGAGACGSSAASPRGASAGIASAPSTPGPSSGSFWHDQPPSSRRCSSAWVCSMQ